MSSICSLCGSEGVPSAVRGMHVRRCLTCGFLWVEKKILPDTYYKEEWDVELAPKKIQSRLRNAHDRIRSIATHISLDNTCDVGTGEGLMVEALANAGYRNCFGLEPSERGTQFARERGIDVVQGTIGNVGRFVQERTSNVVTLFHVIEHLDDPFQDLKTLFDALPPGGFLVIETPNLRGYTSTAIGTEWPLIYPEHLFYFDDCTLPTAVKNAGFEVVAQWRRDFDPFHMSIGESLIRLGLRSRKHKDPAASPVSPAPSHASALPRSSIFLSLVRRILSLFVVWSGRLDYILLIARKPSS